MSIVTKIRKCGKVFIKQKGANDERVTIEVNRTRTIRENTYNDRREVFHQEAQAMSSGALTDITTNATIDLSHWNNLPNVPGVKAGGIFGIIHKATQGMHYVDPTYITRRTQA
ncbi:MAG: hypothetical protein ACYDEO_03010 [Aggregatilineales bacterium]